ncbi:hypothetical protein QF034_000674 [Streptomyces africanus]|uniref:Uncharacterized protein n=1 Tax=Streptomyces africanus TaxID=231024 RepID=A0ABU0QGC6_9ACTN|nr:hypothetical protein [Streptomyces africanus]
MRGEGPLDLEDLPGRTQSALGDGSDDDESLGRQQGT